MRFLTKILEWGGVSLGIVCYVIAFVSGFALLTAVLIEPFGTTTIICIVIFAASLSFAIGIELIARRTRQDAPVETTVAPPVVERGQPCPFCGSHARADTGDCTSCGEKLLFALPSEPSETRPPSLLGRIGALICVLFFGPIAIDSLWQTIAAQKFSASQLTRPLVFSFLTYISLQALFRRAK